MESLHTIQGCSLISLLVPFAFQRSPVILYLSSSYFLMSFDLTVLLPKISIQSLPSQRVPWQLRVGQEHVPSSHPGRFGHRSPASRWPNSSAFVLPGS